MNNPIDISYLDDPDDPDDEYWNWVAKRLDGVLGWWGGYNALRLFRLHGHYGTWLHTTGMVEGDDHGR